MSWLLTSTRFATFMIWASLSAALICAAGFASALCDARWFLAILNGGLVALNIRNARYYFEHRGRIRALAQMVDARLMGSGVN